MDIKYAYWFIQPIADDLQKVEEVLYYPKGHHGKILSTGGMDFKEVARVGLRDKGFQFPHPKLFFCEAYSAELLYGYVLVGNNYITNRHYPEK